MLDLRRTLSVLLAVLAAVCVACGGGGSAASTQASNPASADPLDAYPPSASGPPPGASAAARAAALSLNRGINFGNMLEAPREGDWGLRADDEFINLVGASGLTASVRLPVRWSNHASADAAATIEPAFFARVDTIVQKLLARGVTLVLNMHHYRQLDGDALDPGETAVDAALVRVRFLAMWQQIAQHYAGFDTRLLFEIYNEPHGALEPQWNDLLSRAVRVVRASNPTRVLMLGPVQWNNASALARLALPPDANVVLTVHNYEPFNFTHQGADWISPVQPTGVDCCDAALLARMTAPLALAASEGRRLDYPVVVGEFGAYSKAPQAARIRYLQAMRRALEAQALPWMYWELASGFGLYDPVTHQFKDDMKSALFEP